MSYENTEFGFKATLPEGWAAEQQDDKVLIKPLDQKVGPNITITRVDDVPASLSLHKGGGTFFQKALEDQLGKVEFGNTQVLEIHGHEAIAFNMGYTYVLEDQASGEIVPTHVAKMQVYLKEGPKVWSITGSTTTDKFEDTYPTFRDFAASIELL